MEIAMVVGILALLSTIVIVNMNIRGNKSNANNIKRRTDLESIQQALDLRAQDTGESLPADLPTNPSCIGNGGAGSYNLKAINWTQSVPSPDASITFNARSCNDSTCSGGDDPWSANLTNHSDTNDLSGLADGPYFQYQAVFNDQYPSAIHRSYVREPGNCAGYTDCYTSLAAWESAQNRDLTSAGSNNIEVVEIGGTWANPDTSPVTIDGWTTDATHYIRIYTAPEARHNGAWNTGKYRLETTSADNSILMKERYVRIEGLQIKIGAANYSGIRIDNSLASMSGDIHISSNIIRSGGSGGIKGIVNGAFPVSPFLKIWNNIVYDFTTSYAIYGTVGWYSAVFNNTLYNSWTCFFVYNDGNPSIGTMKNNITQNCIGFELNSGGWNALSNYNISSDNTAPGVNSKRSTTVSFIDAANSDFHLASSDTAAKNAGADLNADANLKFIKDIEGDSRRGLWDIGADEQETEIPDYDFMVKDITIKTDIASIGSDQSFIYTSYNDFKNGTAPTPLLISGSSASVDGDQGAVAYNATGGTATYTSPVLGGCYNLATDLAPLYLGTIPKDPKDGTDENTGYFISVDPATKVVCVKAPGAENDEVIENCRK